MFKKALPFIIAIALVAAGVFAYNNLSASATPPPDLHCEGHNVAPNIKDESGSDDNNIVPVAGTLICVKASTGNTGVITADGVTTLQEYLFNAGIVDGSGDQGRDVSYWVTYPSVPHDECPNIPGNQEEGTDCDPSVHDECPNIPGDQPEGTDCEPPCEEIDTCEEPPEVDPCVEDPTLDECNELIPPVIITKNNAPPATPTEYPHAKLPITG